MESLRFKRFTLLIDGIHKCIHKIKVDTVPSLGIKSVHVFWLYQLLSYPEGLTSAEIAAENMIDRSLVSREIESLRDSGFINIQSVDGERRRGYNSRITLTEEGRELARRISEEVATVQSAADEGITKEELQSFYATLEKLHKNFVNMTTPNGKRNIKPLDTKKQNKESLL